MSKFILLRINKESSHVEDDEKLVFVNLDQVTEIYPFKDGSRLFFNFLDKDGEQQFIDVIEDAKEIIESP